MHEHALASTGNSKMNTQTSGESAYDWHLSMLVYAEATTGSMKIWIAMETPKPRMTTTITGNSKTHCRRRGNPCR